MRINEEIEILKPVSRFSLSANTRYGFRKYHKIGYLYKNTTLVYKTSTVMYIAQINLSF